MMGTIQTKISLMNSLQNLPIQSNTEILDDNPRFEDQTIQTRKKQKGINFLKFEILNPEVEL